MSLEPSPVLLPFIFDFETDQIQAIYDRQYRPDPHNSQSTPYYYVTWRFGNFLDGAHGRELLSEDDLKGFTLIRPAHFQGHEGKDLATR